MGWKHIAIQESLKLNDIAVTDRLTRFLLGIDGGKGSGNFGHSGRPGKVGGSSAGGGKQFRTTTSKGSYVGIQKAKAFKSIAKQARSAKDVNSFVDSLSKEQYEQFVQQYRSSGTKEKILDYTERVMNLMKRQKPDIQPENKIVEGKNIIENYSGSFKPYTDSTTGQLVDEEIENVMSKQGFLGFPKVVSQEDFDKIAKEHPEMPLLYRSFSGRDKEQLQDYDDQLERGEWYVDCGTGGSVQGQGMYCAGVYMPEELHRWDDPYNDGRLNIFLEDMIFTDADGKLYKTLKKVDAESADDLEPSESYIVINKDGSKTMVKAGEGSRSLTDINTGDVYDGEKANETISQARAIMKLVETDLGEFEDRLDMYRKKMVKGALNEMDHYRRRSENMIVNETVPDPPEGKVRASYNDMHYYYDPKDVKKAGEERPKDGMLIAIIPQNKKDFEKYGANAYKIVDGELRYPDGEKLMMKITVDDLEDFEEWAEIEGECDKLKLDPTSSTRLMTLDPSAKIITSNELKNIKRKGYDIREKAKEKRTAELSEFLEQVPFDDAFYESKLYHTMMGEGTGDLTQEQIKKIVDYKKKNPDRMKAIEQMVEKHISDWNAAKEESKKYDKIANLDDGIAAAILGYDAINSQGHGESGSYTIVLNRTKLIISEQRVDTRR